MYEEKRNKIIDYGFEILIGGLLAPIVFGIFGTFFGAEFGAGAGLGMFVMIASWVVIFLAMIFKI